MGQIISKIKDGIGIAIGMIIVNIVIGLLMFLLNMTISLLAVKQVVSPIVFN